MEYFVAINAKNKQTKKLNKQKKIPTKTITPNHTENKSKPDFEL